MYFLSLEQEELNKNHSNNPSQARNLKLRLNLSNRTLNRTKIRIQEAKHFYIILALLNFLLLKFNLNFRI